MMLQRSERGTDGIPAPLPVPNKNGHHNGTNSHHNGTNGHHNGTNGHHAPANLRVSVVIPARNEAKSLPHVLGKVPPWVHEVILVDGLSVDDTSRVAKSELPAIRIVEQTGRGKGNALREGFVAATGDVVVALDADGSMDPGEMDRYVEMLADGYDYVKGSRMLPGASSSDLTLLRSTGNWIFRTLTNVLTGSRYSDLCYGYFAFRRGTVDVLDLRSDGFEIETEINIRAHRAGLRIAEVPSCETERHHGSSQLHALRDGLRILVTIFRNSVGRRDRLERSPRGAFDGTEKMEPVPVPVPIDGDNSHSQNGRTPNY